jgi:hypothetical protein
VDKFPEVSIPETPPVHADLEYRLQLLRALDRFIAESQKAPVVTHTFGNSLDWGHESILKLAKEAIDRWGPLSSKAQRTTFEEFVASLTAR